MTVKWLRRCQWPRDLRRRSAAARLPRLCVRIPPEAWMFICCECCVLSGRGLCNELITRLEESCRMWCVVLCDLENTWIRRPWPNGAVAPKKNGPRSLSPALHCGVWRSMSSQSTCYLSRKKSQWDMMSSGYSVFHSKHYSTSTTSSLLYITYKVMALWINAHLFLNLIFMTRHYTYIRLDTHIFMPVKFQGFSIR